MKCILFLVSLAAAATAGVVSSRDSQAARNYFKAPCSRSLPREDLNACIRKNMQSVLPNFKQGEKLLGLEPLDPLAVGDMHATLNRDPFNSHSLARNSKVHGLTGLTVRDVRAILTDDRMSLEVDVSFPKILIEGEFKTEGKLGNFPYSGKGPYNVTIGDMDATWRIEGPVVERDGERYVQVKHFIPKYQLGSMKAWAENIISGAPELTNLALTFVNQFWEAGVQIMAPVIEPELERVLKGLANNVFSRVPYETLFPAAA